MKLVGDIEGDGLLPELTTLHSLVLKDLVDDTVYSFHDHGSEDGTIREGLALMAKADTLYFHNGVRYDYPAIAKLYPKEWAKIDAGPRLLDTLVLAHIRFIHVKETDYDTHVRQGRMPARQAGLHNLKAWGYRLGIHKQDYEGPWDVWTPIMQTYCEQDVEVTVALVEYLRKAGIPAAAIEMEHQLQEYLFHQELNGWPFDFVAATRLQARLSARREAVGQDLIDTFGEWYEGNGEVSPARSMIRRKGYLVPTQFTMGCAYTKLKMVQFKPTSRHHIAKMLKERFGWKPTEFTPSGLPKVDEAVLDGIDVPEAKMLKEYLLLDKRLGSISEGQQAWLENTEVNPDTGMHHIHHSCRPGPITHRMKHSHPNLGQVPASKSPYGNDCRALFTVPEGWQLMGADVSGLELRILAHHMEPWDDGVYGEAVVNGKQSEGTDVHSLNQQIVGLDSRDDAKTFIYANIYGAGNAKLGTIKAPDGTKGEKKLKSIGRKARKMLQDGLPALASVTDAVKLMFNRKGFVRLLDGRRAYPRAEYSALNTLIQGNGAIVCKTWLVLFAAEMTERFGPQGWGGKWAGLGFIHDEIQIAVRPDIAEEAGQIAIACIRQAGEVLKVKLPLDGAVSLGANWKETH